jgi:recombination protein RecT
MSTDIVKNDEVSMTLKGMLPEIQKMAPSWFNADKLLAIVLHARSTTPAILECTKESIVGILHRSAMTGLDQYGPGGFWIVPMNNKRTGKKEALFVPDYRGLIFLGKKNSVITHGYADVVMEKDEFSLEKGDTPRCIHKPALSKRGNIIGAYAVILLPDGTKHIEWMDRDDLDKVRNSSKAGQCGPWVDWYEEQCKKTVLKRAMKPFSGGNPHLASAMQYDNEALGLNLDRTPIQQPKEREVKPESVSEARPASKQDAPVTVNSIPTAEETGGLEDGEFIVKNVKFDVFNGTAKATGKPFKKFIIHADDGEKYETFHANLGALMEQTQGKDVAIRSEKGKFGNTLNTIRLMVQDAPQSDKPSNDDDSVPSDDGQEQLPM